MKMNDKKNDIAIVGMSCVFPGAKDLQTYWQNIRNKVDAISDVPETRWGSRYYNPESSEVDRFYCKRGGFIDDLVEFDPVEFGIVPITVEGTEPDHLIALKMAKEALKDAGIFEKNISLAKAGIILGKGNYVGTGTTRILDQLRTSEHLVNLLKEVAPDISLSELEKIKKRFQKQTGRYGPDTAMGLIPNLAASLIANRLDLGGAAYTIDAACASSLIAVDHAVQELSTGRCDVVVAGGIHLCQNETFYSVFTQLGALSRQQQIKPFDQQADGLLIGEGCGMVVLKKLDKALEDKDKVYAVIKGVGISSDGSDTSMMSPSVKGQTRAIEQAWNQAGLNPKDVGYIEAHGTGTPLGDATEMSTLKHVFGKEDRTVAAGLGSVKSMIGHTMPAAGMAGLIKTAMALYHGELPPTLHCQEPLETMEDSGFQLVSDTQNWEHSELPKIAGVNAFGFGGINAHVVLEGFEVDKTTVTTHNLEKDEVLILARPSAEELVKALEAQDVDQGFGTHRIALFNPTQKRIEKAIKIVKREKAWRNRNDIWYTPEPLLQKDEKLCFLFPGLDGLSDTSTDDVSTYFNIPKIDRAETSELVASSVGVFENSIILDRALKQLGIQPDCIAGHSLGEWTGYYSAGIADDVEVLDMISKFDPNSLKVPDVYFMAIGAGVEVVTPILKKVENVYLTHDNCIHQSIVCGPKEDIEKCKSILTEEQIFNQVLPFQSGFHSPFFEEYSYQVNDKLSMLKNKAHTPIWSSTIVAPFPEDVESIREISKELLVKPVLFRELTKELYHQENVKVFIQVGSGGLIGFTDDTLKGIAYSGISASSAKRSGINQLQRVVAALFVEGKTEGVSFLNQKKKEAKGYPIKLQLGLPLVTEFENIPTVKKADIEISNKNILEKNIHPVLQTFNANFEEIENAQKEITAALHTSFTSNYRDIIIPETPLQTLLSKSFEKPIELSLAVYPELIDHSMCTQKSGWPYLGDLFPVVPMTMLIELMLDTVQEIVPTLNIVKVTNIQAFKWTDVTTPIHTYIKGTWQNEHQVKITLGEYATAEVTVASRFDTPLVKQLENLGTPIQAPITEPEVYEKAYMFHGPKYQGVTKFETIGTNGMTTVIEDAGGKGSLLDNAGQVFGLWSHFAIKEDYVAFPVKIDEIRFFDEYTDQDTPVECTCELIEKTPDFLTCNMLLNKKGKPWLEIKGWKNRRLGFTKKLWDTSLSVLDNTLSEEIYPNVFIFKDEFKRATAWDFIRKRYLNTPEKEVMDALPLFKSKLWLMGRVAVKDAVRVLLKRQKINDSLYPAEMTITNNNQGKPSVTGEHAEIPTVHISIAHKGKIAVAIANTETETGIDIEEIKDRGESFIALSFHPKEIEILSEKEDIVEWYTRGWAAKEAYGKSLGLGLQGSPKKYTILEIKDNEIRIEDTWIKTQKHKNYIIGWI